MFTSLRRFVLPALIVVLVAAPSFVQAADDDEADPYYETFFGAQIISLSHANLAVGVVGDAIAKKVYEGETAVGVAQAFVGLNAGAHQILVNMTKDKNIDEEDAEVLKQLAEAASHIHVQAEGVLILAKGGDGKQFSEARAKTEKSLEKAMKTVKEYFAE